MVLVTGLLATACKSKNAELPPSDKDNGGLILPDKFEAVVVADSIGNARHIAVNDNGDIYVKLTFNEAMNGGGGSVALRDLNGDGKADSIAYFGDYKDEGGSAVGMTIHDGYLYTSTVRSVLRNKMSPGELIPTSKTETILSDTDRNVVKNWHTTKPVAFDEDGMMYVPFGSPTDAGQDITKYGPVGIPGGKGIDPTPELEGHAGIWRFDPEKQNQTQKDGYHFATGIRSVLGIQWNKKDKSIYAVVNGIDNFHTLYPKTFSSWQAAVLPSEVMIKVKDKSNFGWPYAYFDQFQGKNVLQPGYGGDGKIIGRAKDFDVPVYGFPGHWAPMDLLFYEGNQFPERYKNGAFVAFHGSTDRSPFPQAGYFVCFLPFENGAPVPGKFEVFADGFTQVDTVINTNEAVYRPMGLAVGPDGSLYITDSNKGKIWRVMYKGKKEEFKDTQLTAMEGRKNRSYIKTPDEVADNLHTGDHLEGSILFNNYCATCHQRNGKGDNNRFPPLAGSEWVTGDKERLISTIIHGLQGKITVNGKVFNGFMPPHSEILDDHAVASITTYIRSRWGNQASAITEHEVTNVRKSGPVKKM